MLVTRGKGELSGVAIKGVDPEARARRARPRAAHGSRARSTRLDAGSPPPGELPPIIMGKELAHKLKAKVGDDVTVVVPLSNIDFDTWRAKSSAPRTRKFRVTGIFYSGFDEYDRRLMYTSLRDTQELVGRGDQVMGVELKVKDVDRAERDRREAREGARRPAVPGPGLVRAQPQPVHRAEPPEARARDHPDADHHRRRGEHGLGADHDGDRQDARDRDPQVDGRDVGERRAACSRSLGIAIGGVGTVIGVAIGLVTCYVVSAYGYHLDPKVYLIDRLPIDVRPFEVVLVAGHHDADQPRRRRWSRRKSPPRCARSRACATTST